MQFLFRLVHMLSLFVPMSKFLSSFHLHLLDCISWHHLRGSLASGGVLDIRS